MSEANRRNRSISSWGYVGYSILFIIPVIGFLLLIILSFSKNTNVRSYARSYWCRLVLAIFLIAIFFGLSAMGFLGPYSREIQKYLGSINFNITEYLPQFASSGNTTIAQGNTPRATTALRNETSVQEEKNVEVPTGVTPSFKKAMDAYEAFFDEYVAFIKKMEQNPSDIQVITEYASFMTKYAQYMEEMEALDDNNDLSDADMAYYLEVTGRIYQKLATVY